MNLQWECTRLDSDCWLSIATTQMMTGNPILTLRTEPGKGRKSAVVVGTTGNLSSSSVVVTGKDCSSAAAVVAARGFTTTIAIVRLVATERSSTSGIELWHQPVRKVMLDGG